MRSAAFSLILVAQSFAATPWLPQVEPIAPGLTGVHYDAGAGYRMDFNAAPGSYTVWFSPDLSIGSWVDQATVTVPAGGIAGSHTDAAASSRPKGFYRLEGGITAGAYRLMIPSHTLEWGFGDPPLARGDFSRGMTRFDATLEIRDPLLGGVMQLENGSAIIHGMRPGLGFPDAYGDALPGNRLPLLADAQGFDLPLPEAPFGTPFGSGTEAGRMIEVRPLEPDDNVLAAISPRFHQATTYGPEPADFEGISIELPLLVRKSTNADATDLAGPWGFVVFGGESYDRMFGEEDSGNVIEYRVNVVTGEITAGASDQGTLDVLMDRSFSVRQPFDPARPIEASAGEDAEGFAIPFQLDVDGGIVIAGEPPDGASITGQVSPGAAFMALASFVPGPGISGYESGIDLESEIVLGVKRDTNPDLDGRGFDMLWLSLFIDEGEIEIIRTRKGSTLTFDAAAGEVSANLAMDWDYIGFDGWHGSGGDEEMMEFALPYSVGQDGLILFGFEDEEESFNVSGFLQQEGGLIVMGVMSEEPGENSYETGLLILREIP